MDDEEILHFSSSFDHASSFSSEYEEEVIEMNLTRNPRSEIHVLKLRRLSHTKDERQLLVDLEPCKIVKAVIMV